MLIKLLLCLLWHSASTQVPGDEKSTGTYGKLRLVYEWKQISYNLGHRILLQDRFSEEGRDKRSYRGGDRGVVFRDNATGYDSDFQSRIPDSQKYFIQYNNVPMGVERWRNKLFITMPRRRYGIPSTLNYLDLSQDTGRSPPLRPYPSPSAGRQLVSVYRTRVDECDRLWAVDTGLLEIPDARRQVQTPAIVVFNLNTDRQIHRYQLKQSDLVSERTPGGLASIIVDVPPGQCDSAYAYIADLATYGIVVYSMKDNDSWRVNHNYFSFSPVAGQLRIAGQEFTWNDGIFSIALGRRDADGFRTAYFHPMVSFQEFSVSTRVLRDKALATREFHGDDFKIVGERGNNSQSTAHAFHPATDSMLWAEVGRDAVSCWNAGVPLTPSNKHTLAKHDHLTYPSDIHITGDEVWLMSNRMPRFIYSTLDTNEYNFRIFKGNVPELVRGTPCEPRKSHASAAHAHGSHRG